MKTALLEILDIARDVFLTAGPGTNVLTYLAAFMNNTVLEDQLDFAPNELFSNLFVKNKDQFFDKTPFSASLSNHNPLFSILIDEFDPNEYEDDLFARSIKFNSNNEGVIYTKFKSEDFDGVDDLISKYNIRLKYPTSYRRLIRDGSNVYVKEDEDNSEKVIREILKLQSTVNFTDYANYISSALSSCGFTIDDQDKEDAIRKMFSCSSVYCVYGAAGTGKTTLISHELKLINSTSKLCLANTHPAVENLKRRINDNSCTFATISKVLHESFDKNDFEIVVIDECSNISTRDMSNFLKKIRFKLLILSGDIYQLPSIEFGNWFALLRHFLDKNSYSDLHHPFRNEDEYLLTIWNKVRNLDSTIIEALDTFRICSEINDEILSKPLKDEIILTLNYDGLYGINNLNRILQLGNDQPPVVWKHYTFKVGDPIIFNENCDYGGYIYNNLKGELAKIDINENGDIVFDIIIDITLSSLKNYEYYGFKLLKVLPENKSLVEITVKNSSEKDFDQDTRAMRKVPFQIAYAISIHKAQGLEYNNVKVVITNEIDESITHNVFYTAITRAKKVLKIYWSPESQNKIIKNFEISNCSTDAHILSNKYNFKLVKLK